MSDVSYHGHRLDIGALTPEPSDLPTLQLMDAAGPTGGLYFGPELAWQKRANCAQPEAPKADAFFPGGGRPSNKSKRACLGCPVRDECLDWALTHEEQGIWGGLSEAERNRLLAAKLLLPLNLARRTK